jgi:hypothetical protein
VQLRKVLLFGALAGTVGLVLFYKPSETPSIAPANERPVPSAGPHASTAAESLRLPENRGLSRSRGELFGAPPAAPAPAQAAAELKPAPVAPPMPYRFAGRVMRGGQQELLLSKGDLVFPIRLGDTLDGAYRVESIEADRIELTYLPLGTKERIAVSSVLDVERPRAPLASVPAPVASVPAPVASAPPEAPASDGRRAQLRFEGPREVQAGANFSVALRVSTKESLRAAPMQLRFEPEVLEPVNVRPGKFFGEGSFSYRVNPGGSIFVGATSKGAPPGADAELVVLTFRPIKRGATAQLSMSALNLQGIAGRAIAHEQVTAFRAAIQ